MKTPSHHPFLLLALIASITLATANPATAQTFTNLHTFTSGPVDGQAPGAVILASNHLYGMTYYGGSPDRGTVFKLNPDGTGYTNLHNFSALIPPAYTNTDGADPGGAYCLNATLAAADGVLYGTTFNGGRLGIGTVFKVNVDGTGFTNLHDFAATNGGAPNAGVILADGTLYGATTAGGFGGSGTLFKLNTNGSGFVVLHHFTASADPDYTNSDGVQPIGGLLLADGTLYGTAQAGGLAGYGTVFAINTNGTSFTNLHDFSPSTNDGAYPSGTLILSGSTLYGTTVNGGSFDAGLLFALNTNGSGFTKVYSFPAGSGDPYTNAAGSGPAGGLILAGDTLYGTAASGGFFGSGTLFSVNTNGSSFSNLFNFAASPGLPHLTNRDGVYPSGGLVLSGNALYGTANNGGSLGYGTVFKLSLPLPSLAILPSATNVILSWPASAAGFALQATTNIAAPANWSTVAPAPVVVNGRNEVTNAASGALKFYRLSQ